MSDIIPGTQEVSPVLPPKEGPNPAESLNQPSGLSEAPDKTSEYPEPTPGESIASPESGRPLVVPIPESSNSPSITAEPVNSITEPVSSAPGTATAVAEPAISADPVVSVPSPEGMPSTDSSAAPSTLTQTETGFGLTPRSSAAMTPDKPVQEPKSHWWNKLFHRGAVEAKAEPVSPNDTQPLPQPTSS